MAKRKMPKMAEAENFETKVEEPVVEVSEEPTEVEPVEEVKEEVEEPTVETDTEGETVTVAIDKQLRFRIASSTTADVIELLAPGTKLSVLERQGEWIKVMYNGRVGYVMSKFVQ